MGTNHNIETPKIRKFMIFICLTPNPPSGGEHLKIIELGSSPLGGLGGNVVKLSHQISHFMFKYVDAHDFLLNFPAFFIAVLPFNLRLKNPLIFLKLQSTHNLIFKQLITFVLLDFTLHYNRA